MIGHQRFELLHLRPKMPFDARNLVLDIGAVGASRVNDVAGDPTSKFCRVLGHVRSGEMFSVCMLNALGASHHPCLFSESLVGLIGNRQDVERRRVGNGRLQPESRLGKEKSVVGRFVLCSLISRPSKARVNAHVLSVVICF